MVYFLKRLGHRRSSVSKAGHRGHLFAKRATINSHTANTVSTKFSNISEYIPTTCEVIWPFDKSSIWVNSCVNVFEAARIAANVRSETSHQIRSATKTAHQIGACQPASYAALRCPFADDALGRRHSSSCSGGDHDRTLQSDAGGGPPREDPAAASESCSVAWPDFSDEPPLLPLSIVIPRVYGPLTRPAEVTRYIDLIQRGDD